METDLHLAEPPHGLHPEALSQHVEVQVNRHPVQLIGHRHTGLQIKDAAIAQHVKIERDFLLYRLREHQPNELIGDEQEIVVREDSRFHAIPDDDNS